MSEAPAPSRPVPIPDEASQPFFDAAREGKLLIKRCNECGEWHDPRKDLCDNCFSEDLAWAEASGRGKIYTFGIMHQVLNPGFAGEVPYNVIVVELEEGPRLNSNLVGTPNNEIRVDMPVEVTFETYGDVTVPKFRAASS